MSYNLDVPFRCSCVVDDLAPTEGWKDESLYSIQRFNLNTTFTSSQSLDYSYTTDSHWLAAIYVYEAYVLLTWYFLKDLNFFSFAITSFILSLVSACSVCVAYIKWTN